MVWDAAIAYFTSDEIDKILKNIKGILSHKKGILSGQTNFSGNKNQKFFQHKHEFTTKEEIKLFLKPYFSNVIVIETIYKDRHNFYFWASDGVIPFDKNWEHWIIN